MKKRSFSHLNISDNVDIRQVNPFLIEKYVLKGGYMLCDQECLVKGSFEIGSDNSSLQSLLAHYSKLNRPISKLSQVLGYRQDICQSSSIIVTHQELRPLSASLFDFYITLDNKHLSNCKIEAPQDDMLSLSIQRLQRKGEKLKVQKRKFKHISLDCLVHKFQKRIHQVTYEQQRALLSFDQRQMYNFQSTELEEICKNVKLQEFLDKNIYGLGQSLSIIKPYRAESIVSQLILCLTEHSIHSMLTWQQGGRKENSNIWSKIKNLGHRTLEDELPLFSEDFHRLKNQLVHQPNVSQKIPNIFQAFNEQTFTIKRQFQLIDKRKFKKFNRDKQKVLEEIPYLADLNLRIPKEQTVPVDYLKSLLVDVGLSLAKKDPAPSRVDLAYMNGPFQDFYEETLSRTDNPLQTLRVESLISLKRYSQSEYLVRGRTMHRLLKLGKKLKRDPVVLMTQEESFYLKLIKAYLETFIDNKLLYIEPKYTNYFMKRYFVCPYALIKDLSLAKPKQKTPNTQDSLQIEEFDLLELVAEHDQQLLKCKQPQRLQWDESSVSSSSSQLSYYGSKPVQPSQQIRPPVLNTAPQQKKQAQLPFQGHLQKQQDISAFFSQAKPVQQKRFKANDYYTGQHQSLHQPAHTDNIILQRFLEKENKRSNQNEYRRYGTQEDEEEDISMLDRLKGCRERGEDKVMEMIDYILNSNAKDSNKAGNKQSHPCGKGVSQLQKPGENLDVSDFSSQGSFEFSVQPCQRFSTVSSSVNPLKAVQPRINKTLIQPSPSQLPLKASQARENGVKGFVGRRSNGEPSQVPAIHQHQQNYTEFAMSPPQTRPQMSFKTLNQNAMVKQHHQAGFRSPLSSTPQNLNKMFTRKASPNACAKPFQALWDESSTAMSDRVSNLDFYRFKGFNK